MPLKKSFNKLQLISHAHNLKKIDFYEFWSILEHSKRESIKMHYTPLHQVHVIQLMRCYCIEEW